MQEDDLVKELRVRLGTGTDTFDEILANPLALHTLRLLGGESVDQVVDLVTERNQQLLETATAMKVMAKIGWAPSAHMPTSAVTAAVASIAAGAGTSEVDRVIEEAWTCSPMLATSAMRVGTLGAADDQLREFAAQRSRLLVQAWQHHERGEYAASISIVLPHIEGIIRDATESPLQPNGLDFFKAGKKVDKALADDETLAGMSAALPAVRDWFFDSVATTSTQGALNRHAVLHGRELAYDTRTNSVKAFVLLIAVWEWASRKLAREAERRRQGRYEVHVGSDKTNENGWRMDRRGFSTTRDALRQLAIAHRSFAQRHQRTATLDELRSDIVTKLLLKSPEMIDHRLEPNGTWWAWSRSEAGWVFAIGGVPGDDRTYYTDSGSPPATPPPRPGWRTVDDGNWSGDCYW